MALQAARVGARLVHGLHLEVPPGRLPAVVTVQDVVPLDHPASMPSRAKRAVYRDLLNRSLRRAERIIVPSPATADRLAALGAAPDRIDVIPLGIGPGFRPSSPAEREVARRRFASDRRYVVVATVAKAHKNLTGMGQAAAVLAPEIAVAAPAAATPSRASRWPFIDPRLSPSRWTVDGSTAGGRWSPRAQTPAVRRSCRWSSGIFEPARS